MIARVPIEWGTFRARRALCPRLHRSDRLTRKHVRPSQRIRVRAQVRIAQRDVLCFRVRHRHLWIDQHLRVSKSREIVTDELSFRGVALSIV